MNSYAFLFNVVKEGGVHRGLDSQLKKAAL